MDNDPAKGCQSFNERRTCSAQNFKADGSAPQSSRLTIFRKMNANEEIGGYRPIYSTECRYRGTEGSLHVVSCISCYTDRKSIFVHNHHLHLLRKMTSVSNVNFQFDERRHTMQWLSITDGSKLNIYSD